MLSFGTRTIRLISPHGAALLISAIALASPSVLCTSAFAQAMSNLVTQSEGEVLSPVQAGTVTLPTSSAANPIANTLGASPSAEKAGASVTVVTSNEVSTDLSMPPSVSSQLSAQEIGRAHV